MKVIRYGNEKSENILIQMIGMHEIPFLENEVKLIREYSGTEDFQLHAVKVDDWNRELSPWVAPAALAMRISAARGGRRLSRCWIILKMRFTGSERSIIRICIWEDTRWRGSLRCGRRTRRISSRALRQYLPQFGTRSSKITFHQMT